MKILVIIIIFLSHFFYLKYNLISQEYENIKFNEIYFNAVSKNLSFGGELPKYLEKIISDWFNEKFKVNGFNGHISLDISNYREKILTENKRKKIDVSLDFNLLLNNGNDSQTKTMSGNISSFGEITGNFSLNDFDKVIDNTHLDILDRLSKEIKKF